MDGAWVPPLYNAENFDSVAKSKHMWQGVGRESEEILYFEAKSIEEVKMLKPENNGKIK